MMKKSRLRNPRERKICPRRFPSRKGGRKKTIISKEYIKRGGGGGRRRVSDDRREKKKEGSILNPESKGGKV